MQHRLSRLIEKLTPTMRRFGGHLQDIGHNFTVTTKQQHLPDTISDLSVKHIALPIISVLIILGNVLLISVVCRHRHLHTPTSVLITGLALSDLLVGALVIPLMVVAEAGLLGSEPKSCLVVMCIAVVHLIVSCLIVIVIAIERFISIKWPLRHRVWCGVRKITATVVLCWVYGIVVGGFLPLFGWNSLDLQTLVLLNGTLVHKESGTPWQCRYHAVFTGSYAAYFFIGHFVSMWICSSMMYLQIYLNSRDTPVYKSGSTRRLRKTRSKSRYSTKESFKENELDDKSSPRNRNFGLSSSKENWRAMRILLLLVGIFVICWLPLVVWYGVLYKGFTKPYITSSITTPLPYWVYNSGVILAFANSAVNPILYGFGNRSVRQAGAKSIACLNHGSGNEVAPNQQMLMLD